MEIDFQTRIFLSLLDECYFHPSRRKCFPCARIELYAKLAMLFLWCSPCTVLLEVEYGQEQVREMLLNNMLPEHLDEAVRIFCLRQEFTKIPQLAQLILAAVIYYDPCMGMLYKHDQRLLAGVS